MGASGEVLTLTLTVRPGWWLTVRAITRDLGVPMSWERAGGVVRVDLGDVSELAARIAVETWAVGEYEISANTRPALYPP